MEESYEWIIHRSNCRCKKIREVAEENAKKAILESVTPKIREFIDGNYKVAQIKLTNTGPETVTLTNTSTYELTITGKGVTQPVQLNKKDQIIKEQEGQLQMA